MSIILHYYVTPKTAIVDHCWAFETQRRVQSCSFISSCFSPACSFAQADHHTWHGLMWLKLRTHDGAGAELHQCQYWRAGAQEHSTRSTVWVSACAFWAARRYGCTGTMGRHAKTNNWKQWNVAHTQMDLRTTTAKRKKKKKGTRSIKVAAKLAAKRALMWMLISVKRRRWKENLSSFHDKCSFLKLC